MDYDELKKMCEVDPMFNSIIGNSTDFLNRTTMEIWPGNDYSTMKRQYKKVSFNFLDPGVRRYFPRMMRNFTIINTIKDSVKHVELQDVTYMWQPHVLKFLSGLNNMETLIIVFRYNYDANNENIFALTRVKLEKLKTLQIRGDLRPLRFMEMPCIEHIEANGKEIEYSKIDEVIENSGLYRFIR